MSTFSTETVTCVHQWTETLFSFRATRDRGFRFLSGQFVMIGLPADGKPLLRAYSVVSPHYDDELEFLSIKVPDGPLTSRLKDIRPGDPLLVGRKATGTLLADNLRPGRNLFLVATGTGLAPFLSLIRDPDLYTRFERIVLVHGVRKIAELAYSEMIERELAEHALVGAQASRQLHYFPTVTREPFWNRGRITELVASGKLFGDLGLPVWDGGEDRAMLCGSPQMLAEMVGRLRQDGFIEGSSSTPGSYVIEKAFVEK